MSSQTVSIVREGVANLMVFVARSSALTFEEISAEAGRLTSLCAAVEDCDAVRDEDLLTRLWIALAWVRRESANFGEALLLRRVVGRRIGLGDIG